MPLPPDAQERIERLLLAPHPEGGYFREFFRSEIQVAPSDGRGMRAGLTAIHFLLPGGTHSRWHEVRSDEQWTFLEGDALELFVVSPGAKEVRRITLGPLEKGGVPSFVVPAGGWQAARPLGRFTLVTCAVGPGFDFADFRLLSEAPESRARIEALAPELVRLL